MTDQSDFESLVGLSMSKPAVPSGMAGFFLAIRDCEQRLRRSSERRERHFRSLLVQFGLTPKSKHGLAAREAL